MVILSNYTISNMTADKTTKKPKDSNISVVSLRVPHDILAAIDAYGREKHFNPHRQTFNRTNAILDCLRVYFETTEGKKYMKAAKTEATVRTPAKRKSLTAVIQTRTETFRPTALIVELNVDSDTFYQRRKTTENERFNNWLRSIDRHDRDWSYNEEENEYTCEGAWES